MEEIDNHFYDHVLQDELATSESGAAHHHDMHWFLNDSLQPGSHSKSERKYDISDTLKIDVNPND